MAVHDGRTPRPIVLAGTRGVGKTVVLGEAAARAADEHTWLTAAVEVRPERPFIPHLIERLVEVTNLYRQTKEGSRPQVTGATVRASVLGVGGGMTFSRSPQPSPPAIPLDQAVAEACLAAIEHNAGVVITIDELQLATKPELGDFAATLQQHVPDGWPLVVVLAGLPSVRSTHKGATYLERAEWHALDLLKQKDTIEALQTPAESAGRPMRSNAAQQFAVASGGYPYAIQLIGHHAWRASAGASEITAAHVPTAIDNADVELSAGLYAARFEDSSDREREYLLALARLTAVNPDTPVTGAAVAAALAKTPKSLSYLRDRLIQKGTVFAEGDSIRFAIPGMATWLVGPTGTEMPRD